jgi:hypothetical protein
MLLDPSLSAGNSRLMKPGDKEDNLAHKRSLGFSLLLCVGGAVLGFELRASHLLGHLSHAPSPFFAL